MGAYKSDWTTVIIELFSVVAYFTIAYGLHKANYPQHKVRIFIGLAGFFLGLAVGNILTIFGL